MKTSLTAVALLTLTACMGPQKMFYKEDYTPAQFQKDKQQCIYEAKLATASASSSTPRNVSAAIGQGLAEGYGQFKIENDLIIQCMAVKGYAYR